MTLHPNKVRRTKKFALKEISPLDLYCCPNQEKLTRRKDEVNSNSKEEDK